jgi:hypothetical protein
MRVWLAVPLLALGACTSETMERDAMGIYKSDDSSSSRRRDAEPQPEAPPEAPRGTVITIPAEAHNAQAEFIDRPSTIFADAVEVDLSREPYLALASFTIARDAVSRQDREEPDRGVLSITLERVAGSAVTKDSVPTVRFGDGLRIVGVDRIVLRFWSQQSAERPVWFHAAGAGKSAFFNVDGQPPQAWRGKSIDVRSEIHKVGSTYRFDSSAEAKP